MVNLKISFLNTGFPTGHWDGIIGKLEFTTDQWQSPRPIFNI